MTDSRTPRTLGKLTAAYHWRDGAHFDHDYYGDAHARLAIGLLAPLGLLRFESERAAVAPPPRAGALVACASAWFDSLASAQAAAAATMAALAADVPNYTDLRPVLHVCEVTGHRLPGDGG